MANHERMLYGLLWGMLAAVVILGCAMEGIPNVLRDVWEIQRHPARLLNDFTVVSEGAALVNAALVAAFGLLLIGLNQVRLSGPTVAAVFTMLGFGLFGKTVTNAAPIILGVYIAAKLWRKSFSEYILIALFGTALGPLVVLPAVELGLPLSIGIPTAVAAGLITGILLPALAVGMLRFHQGFSLYNIGMTSGFFAIFVAAIITASSGTLQAGSVWNAEPSAILIYLVPAISAVLCLMSVLTGRRNLWSGFRSILGVPGRLPTDFMDVGSVPGALLNMGLLGFVFWGYVVLVGGTLNGPIIGGILTVMGFAAFGKHPGNVWAVALGIVAATLLFGKDPADAGPLLAFLFGTTLAPLAGEFGPGVGFMAGFLHLVMVERTGAWHLGINLYNNGFAGGLTATLFVVVIDWYRSNRDTSGRSRRDGDSEKTR